MISSGGLPQAAGCSAVCVEPPPVGLVADVALELCEAGPMAMQLRLSTVTALLLLSELRRMRR